MKKPKAVYAYLNKEPIGRFNSIKEAAERTNLTSATVGNIARGKQKVSTSNGYYFSFKKLTQDEIEYIPMKENKEELEYVKVDGKSCRKVVDKCSYEVDCNNKQVCFFPRSKQAKIQDFKKFIYSKMYDRWMLIPQKVATLERVYINEFLNAMENT